MTKSNFLSLTKLPDSSELHIWADYVELRCLIHPDLTVSKADVQSYVRKRVDLRKGLEDFADDGVEDDDPEDELGDAPADIRRAARAEDLFKHLEYRATVFGNFYPFTLPRSGNTLSRRTRLTQRHKLYLFFLLAANTGQIIDRRHRNKFTRSFEVVSVEALREYLPPGSEVHLFGANSLNCGRYARGHIVKRIKRLADDLGEEFIGHEDQFNPQGDNGLDVVGWIPLKDTAQGFILIMGQCACGLEDWPRKQHESALARWGKIIRFTALPSNMIFIPFCYRYNDGGWHNNGRKIEQSIVMDRVRLIHLLENKYRTLKDLPKDLIDQAVRQQESTDEVD